MRQVVPYMFSVFSLLVCFVCFVVSVAPFHVYPCVFFFLLCDFLLLPRAVSLFAQRFCFCLPRFRVRDAFFFLCRRATLITVFGRPVLRKVVA